MEAFILAIINQFGYLAIAGLIAIENIFPPIPSEIILTFGGFLTTSTHLSISGVIGASTIGSVLGALVLYGIGRLLTPARLEQLLTMRIFRILGFKASDVQASVMWFHTYGTKAVFFGRFVPIIRSLISIPAGITKLSWPIFLIYTTIGSLIWNSVLVSLGVFAGESWSVIASSVGLYAQITLVLLAILILVGGFFFIKKRRQQ